MILKVYFLPLNTICADIVLCSYINSWFLFLQPNAESDDDITPLLSSVAAGSLPCLELLIQVHFLP